VGKEVKEAGMAIVPGGGRGTGKAVASGLAEAGAEIAFAQALFLPRMLATAIT